MLTSVLSVTSLGLILYLVLSSQVALALMPVLGTGGLYAEADTLTGDVGTVYPEYQDDNTNYNQPVGTTTPECGGSSGGIPMLVVELDGQARGLGFYFRKDVQIPFIQERFMSIQIGKDQSVGISGQNLKLFVSQLGGDELLIRNARVNEGGPGGSGDGKWGSQSEEFYLKGGLGTDPTVPGLRATRVSAWLHAATGEQITLETAEGPLDIQVSYPTRSELYDFYSDRSGPTRFGYGRQLTDENPDDTIRDPSGDRIERGIESGGAGYIPCEPSQVPVRP
jgi:hypothetical protein